MLSPLMNEILQNSEFDILFSVLKISLTVFEIGFLEAFLFVSN